jgi:NADPH:quinone reductase-like Zn-dependent oxidoreductase
MKAIIYHNYGSPLVLKCEEIAKPVPADDEVLIKVRGASVNPSDRLFRGTSYLVRLLVTGLLKPKDIRVGTDVAGQVEAVGRGVTDFKPGDEVFGGCRGAFAEYARGSHSKLALKPVNVTFEQAASVPVAALTALQGLRDKGKIQPGQKVLINGAAGGVGTFAVQIAKSFGADVTGVCSTKNVDMVRSIGADQVIDYTQQNFTKSGQHYDMILDLAGTHSFAACRQVLNPKGVFVLAGMVARPHKLWIFLTCALKGHVLSWFVSQKFVMFIARLNNEDLAMMGELIAARKVTPVIDKRYSLSEVPEAIRYLEEGHARGKVVITFGYHDKT